MSDFKVNGITPEEGKIKVGSANVKRIYQGDSWVWPRQDDTYTPNFLESNFHYIANTPIAPATAPAMGTPEGFAIFDSNGNIVSPPKPFAPLPTFENFHNANFNHYSFVSTGHFTSGGTFTRNSKYADRYTLLAVSNDYKYMLGVGYQKYGFYYYEKMGRFSQYDNYYLGRNKNCLTDTIIFSNDYGQSWKELNLPLHEFHPDERFNGYQQIKMSDTGQTILIEYTTFFGAVPYSASGSQYVEQIRFGYFDYIYHDAKKYVLVSKDYGKTFKPINNKLLNRKFDHPSLTPLSFESSTVAFAQRIIMLYLRSPARAYLLRGSETPFDYVKMSSTGKYILVARNSYSRAQFPGPYVDLWLSTDFGESFTNLFDKMSYYFQSNPIPEVLFENQFGGEEKFYGLIRQVMDMEISGNGKVIYLSSNNFNSYDFYSDDYGETWKYIQKPGEPQTSNVVKLDFLGKNIFYVPPRWRDEYMNRVEHIKDHRHQEYNIWHYIHNFRQENEEVLGPYTTSHIYYRGNQISIPNTHSIAYGYLDFALISPCGQYALAGTDDYNTDSDERNIFFLKNTSDNNNQGIYKAELSRGLKFYQYFQLGTHNVYKQFEPLKILNIPS